MKVGEDVHPENERLATKHSPKEWLKPFFFFQSFIFEGLAVGFRGVYVMFL